MLLCYLMEEINEWMKEIFNQGTGPGIWSSKYELNQKVLSV